MKIRCFIVEDLKFIKYIFYESGLSVNVMYSLTDPKKRAVGFKLRSMEVLKELDEKSSSQNKNQNFAGNNPWFFFL